MQKTTAIQFLNRLFSELWSQPDPAKVAEFYHHDLTGYFGDEVITFTDIQHRALFSQQTFSSVQTEILDVVAEGDQIAARFKQTATRKDGAKPLIHHPIGIYRLRDGKVSHVWFLTDKPFNYKEKA